MIESVLENIADIEDKKNALEKLQSLFVSPFKNAIDYTEQNIPFFRPEVMEALSVLGENDFKKEIVLNGEVEATTELAHIIKKHRALLYKE